MYNFLDKIIADPGHTRQFRTGDQLMAEFTCPLENAQQDMWSHASYFVYVLEGRKDWRSADGKLELRAGDMAFVKKGGSLVDQYLSSRFCVLLFFMSDAFICEVLRTAEVKGTHAGAVPSLTAIHSTSAIEGYMHSMMPHFRNAVPMEPTLLDLKLRELLMLIASEPANAGFVAGFQAMMQGAGIDRLRRIMEDNYCYNLSLEAFARLCGRSLSAFKRDFDQAFGTAPGRWLRDRRLQRARLLLGRGDLQVSEVAFQCGFENLSHFSRAYKEVFGHPPAMARKASVG